MPKEVDTTARQCYNTYMLKKRKLSQYRETGSMTLPDERYRSMIAADRLLKDLCDPRTTPRVPQAVRDRARHVLRHWPDVYYINRLAAETSGILESNQAAPDALYKMVKEHTVK